MPTSVHRHSAHLQLELACAELEHRLQLGEDCSAEEYLEVYPELASDDVCAVDLIHYEWVLRRQLGSHPTSEEWLSRYSKWETQLRPLMRMESLADRLHSTRHAPARNVTRLPSISENLDHLELKEELGRGGMGEVYRAWDPVLHRFVAVKTIRADLASYSSMKKRFAREAQAAARLHHPGIVPIYHIGSHNGKPCFTMPLLEGKPLSQCFSDFQSHAKNAVGFMEKVSRAVHHAHERGVLHRDMKPGNIFVQTDGEPLVADFGLARLFDEESDLTRTGDLMGTPPYMAPEQFPGQPWPISPATDLWALGIMLYELIGGQRPFTGTSHEELAPQILNKDAPPLRSLRPLIDARLEAIVLKCLRRIPTHRFATVQELADELGRWHRDEPVLTAPESGPRRLLRRHRRAYLASCLGVLGAGIGLGTERAMPERDPTKIRHVQPVTLIDENGEPQVPTEWVLGKEQGTETKMPGMPYSIDVKKGTGLVRLNYPLKWRATRIEAEVQHVKNHGRSGLVGIAWGMRSPKDAKGNIVRYFFRYFFAETGIHRARAYVKVTSTLISPQGDTLNTDSRGIDLNTTFTPYSLNPNINPWRKLITEIRPEGLRAWWDNQHLGISSFTKLNSVFCTVNQRLRAKIRFHWTPVLSLYLLVQKGVGWFRSVRVKPLI